MGIIDSLKAWKEKQQAANSKVDDYRDRINPDTRDEALKSLRIEKRKWDEMEEKKQLKTHLEERKKAFASKNMFGNSEESVVKTAPDKLLVRPRKYGMYSPVNGLEPAPQRHVQPKGGGYYSERFINENRQVNKSKQRVNVLANGGVRIV